MRKDKKHSDPDDMFAETRMSFGDHIEDLRKHLWRAIIGFLVCLVFSFWIGSDVLRFIARPVELELKHFHMARAERIKEELASGNYPALAELNEPRDFQMQINKRELLQSLGIKRESNPAEAGGDEFITLNTRVRPLSLALATEEAVRLFAKPDVLATMSVTEGFIVWLKVCMVSSLVIGSPWIFWQLWSFVAAGLYAHEKKYVHYYLPFSLGLFLAGVAVCELLVMPAAVRFLLGFNARLGLEPDLRLNEWLGFAILMPLVFGLSFQTPIVMLALAKLGIFTAATSRAKRRIAWFIMALVTALVVPSSDFLSMFLMWGPMCGLYELGIILAAYVERSDKRELDVPEPGEMVEV